MKFLSCFGARGDEEALIDGKKPGCIFCDITPDTFDIVYEDDEFIAFRDRWPRAREHLLIIPRKHVVGTVPQLTARDVGMLTRMKAVGHALSPKASKMGYHIPPFSSVHHLHLHVFTPPFTALGRIMYPVSVGVNGGKGWSWFVTPDQAVSILEGGGKIGLARQSGFTP